MDWSWANTIEQALRGSGVPLWGWLAFLLVLVTVLTIVLRADKNVANVALALVSLAAVAGFVLSNHSGGEAPSEQAAAHAAAQGQGNAAMAHPALACLDGLAGEAVERACETRLFSAPDVTAAAVSSVAARLNQLRTVADGRILMTPDLFAMRVALEHDRFGLVAHVLKQRDGCTPQMCDAFRIFVKRDAIVANMESGAYDKLIERYAQAWAAPGAAAALASTPSAPAASSAGASGVPTNANFPSAASIPPVSIMNNEPGTQSDAADKAETPAPARTAIPKPKPPKPAAAATPRPRNATAPIQIAPQGTGAAPQASGGGSAAADE